MITPASRRTDPIRPLAWLGGTLALALATPHAARADTAAAADAPWQAPGAANPLLPGYFADPAIVRHDGRWYLYATIDPWGGERLGLWTSDNGRDWTFSTPEWPTKAAATGPSSSRSMVWAPSVVRGPDGRWFMYVSVGSEVWVGVAPAPGGPWADANGGRPLIARDFAPDYHMIDAEAFVDDDGQAYLYWGSGWNWTNGRCFVVRLKPDMVSFDGVPRDVTPPGYFEAPFMVKRGGRYLLTYSDGNTTKDTYKVRYAVGATPFGPFTEGAGSPILQTDRSRDVISPGHHAIFRSDGADYILYHRQHLPFRPEGGSVLRQVVVDPLAIGDDGTIAPVTPSHGAAVRGFAAGRDRGLSWRASGDGAAPYGDAGRAADDNYATAWRPVPGAPMVLTADLGAARPLRESRLRPLRADSDYGFVIEHSSDGVRWQRAATLSAVQGSPIPVRHPVTARYLRLTMTAPVEAAGLWEWSIF